MLFLCSVGEVFQTIAVKELKPILKLLLDQRPDEVTILENNQPKTVKAEVVNIGTIIQLKPGEKSGLDGELLTDNACLIQLHLQAKANRYQSKGETVLAGMINPNTVAQVKVTTAYTDSKLSKILELECKQQLNTKSTNRIIYPKVCKNIYTNCCGYSHYGYLLFLVENYIF